MFRSSCPSCSRDWEIPIDWKFQAVSTGTGWSTQSCEQLDLRPEYVWCAGCGRDFHMDGIYLIRETRPTCICGLKH